MLPNTMVFTLPIPGQDIRMTPNAAYLQYGKILILG